MKVEPAPYTTSSRTRFVFVEPYGTKDGHVLYRDGSPAWRVDLAALLLGIGALLTIRPDAVKS